MVDEDDIHWKSGQPLYRAMDVAEYNLWIKHKCIPPNISFSNDLDFAHSFNPHGGLIIVTITPNDLKFDESYKRIIEEDNQDEEANGCFLDLPFEVMFDISFTPSEVRLNIYKPGM